MEFQIYGHRHGDFIITQQEPYRTLWLEVCESLSSITDEDIILEYDGLDRASKKSISEPINLLIYKELVARGWEPESFIFADPEYRTLGAMRNGRRQKGRWQLDFAKDTIAMEVGFNHRSDISWNLIKPTLSAELNHVEKAIQTECGIVVTATRAMKRAGGFDGAVGTYEDYVQYLKPMQHMLTVPLLIVGLEAPTTFRIRQRVVERF